MARCSAVQGTQTSGGWEQSSTEQLRLLGLISPAEGCNKQGVPVRSAMVFTVKYFVGVVKIYSVTDGSNIIWL